MAHVSGWNSHDEEWASDQRADYPNPYISGDNLRMTAPPALRRRRWSDAAYNRRSLELATATRLGWRVASTDVRLGVLAFTLRPTPGPERGRMVAARYVVSADTVECECPYGQVGQPCVHAGVALIQGRYVTRATTQPWAAR